MRVSQYSLEWGEGRFRFFLNLALKSRAAMMIIFISARLEYTSFLYEIDGREKNYSLQILTIADIVFVHGRRRPVSGTLQN